MICLINISPTVLSSPQLNSITKRTPDQRQGPGQSANTDIAGCLGGMSEVVAGVFGSGGAITSGKLRGAQSDASRCDAKKVGSSFSSYPQVT